MRLSMRGKEGDRCDSLTCSNTFSHLEGGVVYCVGEMLVLRRTGNFVYNVNILCNTIAIFQ